MERVPSDCILKNTTRKTECLKPVKQLKNFLINFINTQNNTKLTDLLSMEVPALHSGFV
jgi:hypothetical protein